MFRGTRTFVANVLGALKDELNRFANDVHDGFRSVDETTATLREDLTTTQGELDVAEVDIDALEAAVTAIEAPNAGTQSNSVAIGGATPHTFAPTAVTPTKSGTFLVTGSISTTLGGFTANLRVDGATVASLGTTGPGTAMSVTITRVVALNPAVTHTFGIQAAGGGGGTTAIGFAQISWVEL